LILKGRPSISKEEHQTRMKLYNKGYSDLQIALNRGYFTAGPILAWRKKHGLPANNGPKGESLKKQTNKFNYLFNGRVPKYRLLKAYHER
jgi:hypothetical protein